MLASYRPGSEIVVHMYQTASVSQLMGSRIVVCLLHDGSAPTDTILTVLGEFEKPHGSEQ